MIGVLGLALLCASVLLLFYVARRRNGPNPPPWSMEGLPESYLAGQMQAIVNFEIPVTRIEGKFKLNQNRTAEDRAGVIASLRKSPLDSDRATAKLMAAREEA